MLGRVLNASRNDIIPVARFGRTTGFTLGFITSSPVLLNLPDTYGFTGLQPGRCFGGTGTSRDGHRFMARGDEGSIAIHEPSGAQIGLCFGSTCGRGLLVPLHVVFDDVFRTTGYKVVEPTYIRKFTVILKGRLILI
jgi:hypothetical protein